MLARRQIAGPVLDKSCTIIGQSTDDDIAVSGNNCEQDIDECLSVPCYNNASCSNLPGSYQCNCTLGYTGALCDSPVCSSHVCLNGGTCSVSSEHWWCDCPQYYEGNECSVFDDARWYA